MAKSAARKRTAAKAPAGKARAFGRSLKDFPELNEAELKLIEQTRNGELAYFGEEIQKSVDEKKTRTIRAGLVRFLALGGDDATPVHERGVRVQGATIKGELDLQGCTLAGDLNLWNCELTDTLTLHSARARTVNLEGSRCQDIEADGVEIAGDLDLRDKFVAQGAVRLLGAKIEGNLDCGGGQFAGQDKDGNALLCDGIEVGGGVYLRNGFEAQGAVRLIVANIKGDLSCIGGRFEGADEDGDALVCDSMQVGGDVFLSGKFVAQGMVRLLGANIAGDLVCAGGSFGALPEKPATTTDEKPKEAAAAPVPTVLPLIAARATVQGTLWLGSTRSPVQFHGGVDITGAHVGRMVDAVTEHTKPREPDAAPAGAGDSPAFLMLDGLVYDRFGELTDMSAQGRIAFLRLQRDNVLGKDFKPQPWTQMVKALREAGHTDAAREVAIEYEKARRSAGWLNSKTLLDNALWGLHWLYGVLVGYGHRPLRLVAITLGLWLAFGIFYHYAAVQGVFAPSNPLVFQNSAYAQCSPDYDRFAEELPPKVGNWYWCKALPAEYTTFNPYLYSLDLILPLVDLQQDKDWAPIIPTPHQHDSMRHWMVNYMLDLFSLDGWRLGHLVRFVMWFEILFGWAASLLFVSVAAGFIKRMDAE